jgi:hypothetical protein
MEDGMVFVYNILCLSKMQLELSKLYDLSFQKEIEVYIESQEALLKHLYQDIPMTNVHE